jgi:hypothetical protein
MFLKKGNKIKSKSKYSSENVQWLFLLIGRIFYVGVIGIGFVGRVGPEGGVEGVHDP